MPHSDLDLMFKQLDLDGEYCTMLSLSLENESPISKFWEIHSLWKLARVDEAIKKAEQYEDLFAEDLLFARYKNRLGSIISTNGNLENALKLYQDAKIIYEKHGEQELLADTVNNIAIIHWKRADYSIAYDKIMQSLKLYKEINARKNMAISLNNIGIFLIDLGRITEAKDYLKRALKIKREFNNRSEITLGLCNLIVIHSDGDRNSAELYLNELHEIRDLSTNPTIELYHDYACAVYLQTSTRLKEKSRSEELFEKIIKTNTLDNYFTLESIPRLIELLIHEFKMYGEDIVLQEIHEYLNLMLHISKRDHLYGYSIKALIIQGQLSHIDGNLINTRNIFTKAIDLAHKKNLSSSLVQIKVVEKEILQEFEDMKVLLDNNESFTRRLEHSRLMDYLKDIQNVEK